MIRKKNKCRLASTRLEPYIDDAMQSLIDKEGMTRSLWLRRLIMRSVLPINKGIPHEKNREKK